MKATALTILSTFKRTSTYQHLSAKFKLLRSTYKTQFHFLERNFWPILVVLTISHLLLSLVPLSILLNLAILAVAMRKTAQQKMEGWLQVGIVNLLPSQVRYLLLHRSLLDILADFWFMPAYLKKYAQVLLMPLFDQNLRPEKIDSALKTLGSQQRKLFIRKGLLFNCPRWVSKFMLPHKKKLKVKQDPDAPQGGGVSFEDSTQSDLERMMIEGHSDHANEDDESIQDILEDLNIGRHQEFPIAREQIESSVATVQDMNESISQLGSDIGNEIPLKKHNSAQPNKANSLEGKSITKHLGSVMDQSPQTNKRRQIMPFRDNELPNTRKTQVIISSEQIMQMKAQNILGRVDPRWDQLESYQRQRKSSFESKSRRQLIKKEKDPVSNFISADRKFQILKLLMELRNGRFFERVNNRTAFMMGGASLSFVVLQLIMSRRARKWTLRLFQFSLYMTGSLGLAVSIILIVVKMHFKREERNGDRSNRLWFLGR